MKPTKNETLSPFADAALSLDSSFADFSRLAEELEKKSVDSDKGLERALELLTELDSVGQGIGTKLQTLVTALEEARRKTEESAALVSQRAAQVQERRHIADVMAERLRLLGETAKEITRAVGEIPPPNEGVMQEEERTQLVEIGTQLKMLVECAAQLKEDAHQARLESFERSAHWLVQSLQSAHRRLTQSISLSSVQATLPEGMVH